ncbi:hypothetical protein ACFCT7_09010 [Fulvivirgaceae bacterium LMO-SS25]
MKIDKFFNILEGFDFNLLDSSEFKEDSVREEVILPIIKGLGYSASEPNQIIRSKKLLHPFVSIGSRRKEIYIIPDYLFNVSNISAWILDAKAPSEIITKSKHVEQAYSYAIHSEVRVNFFALCNGKEFVLYDIQKINPVLHFPIKSIPIYWESLKKFLAPENVFAKDHVKLVKDLGLHLKRLGFDKYDSLIFPNVRIVDIVELAPEMFSISEGINTGEEDFVVTFDFGLEALNQLIGKIPKEAIEKLRVSDPDSKKVVRFNDGAFLATVDCKVGDLLAENNEEIFLPLIVNRFL